VTRAGFLWKSGERYLFNPKLQAPDCWTPTTTFAAFVEDGAPSEATRVLPPAFTPGRPVTVSIRVSPAAGVANYAVEEVAPAGWTILRSSEGTIARGSVRFGPFFDAQERAFTYTVLPPENALGGRFNGYASFDGSRDLIGGASTLRHSHGIMEGGDGQRVRLRFNATPGQRFEVEMAPSLDAEEWKTVGTIEGAETPVDFNSVEASNGGAFFRLRPLAE
jgi:hypothetical protein